MKKKVYRERYGESQLSNMMFEINKKAIAKKLEHELKIMEALANNDIEKIEVKRPMIDENNNFNPGGIVLTVKPKKRKKKEDK